MKKRNRSYLIVTFIMTFLIAAEMPLVVRASLTNEVIEESQKAVDQANQDKKNLQSGLSGIKDLLKSLESAKGNLEDYVTRLDANLAELASRIDELNALLDEKEAEIKTKKEELDAAKQQEEEQYAAMKKRIKFMYEKGSASYLEMILSAESFTEFLNKAEFINKISEYDRTKLDEYIATKESIAEQEAQLELEQQALEQVKASIAEEQEAVSTLIHAKEEEIVYYESDITNKEQAVKAYEAEIAAQNAMIKELEATIAAEKKRLLAENKSAISYDGGQFKWPAPDYKRISDDYGMRMHPTLGMEQFHHGIDLASASGSRILAAYDGEVVAAAYSSTMGNYIMIDHGDGLYTI